MRPAGHRRYAAQTSDIVYGPDTRDNMLDIWRHRDVKAGDRAPVVLQIPGGAWTVNGRRPQGYPLMGRMAELGWVCVSIDYSKSPRKSWPAHIIDVKRALAWVRENIADYGGDPDFIAVTGGSAGGHLASLVALTANDTRLQPGFEEVDTTVQAAAPFYGVYDLTDTEKMNEMMMPFLELFVMKERYADKPELFELASPDYACPSRGAAIFRAARRERFGDPERAGTGLLRRASRGRSSDCGLRRAAQRAPRFRPVRHRAIQICC